jgi:hypothetical protein
MSTQRLPIPGGDDGDWGTILNGFLGVSLNGDGTVQPGALTQAGGEITSNKGQPSGYAGLNSSSQVPIANIPIGTTATTVALGSDSRLTGALQTSANLSDIDSPATALANLGGQPAGSYVSASAVTAAGDL